MNILRIIPSMDPASGGPCQGIRHSIVYLEKLGVHNEVVSLDSPTAYFLGTDSFLLHALGPGKSPWGYSPELFPWLIDNLSRFDVLIVHGLWLYHGHAVLQALKKHGRLHHNLPKLYVMPHGMLDPWFQKAKGRKMKAIRNWFYWKLVERKLVNEADGVLFTCEEELRLARQAFQPYHPKRELNVGYGIPDPPPYHSDMEKDFKIKCPALKNAPYLLFLSRIHIKKGVDLLINTYLELKKQGWHLPKLVIAGPGLETAYGQQMQQLASTERDIIFPGMLSGNAKWGALYGCEAFILPSHQENFGIAVVEALACGKPVLISNQVNIWREIEKEKAGIIANDTKEGVISQLTQWSLLPEKERQKMEELTKSTVAKYFSVIEAAKRMKAAISI